MRPTTWPWLCRLSALSESLINNWMKVTVLKAKRSFIHWICNITILQHAIGIWLVIQLQPNIDNRCKLSSGKNWHILLSANNRLTIIHRWALTSCKTLSMEFYSLLLTNLMSLTTLSQQRSRPNLYMLTRAMGIKDRLVYDDMWQDLTCPCTASGIICPHDRNNAFSLICY